MQVLRGQHIVDAFVWVDGRGDGLGIELLTPIPSVVSWRLGLLFIVVGLCQANSRSHGIAHTHVCIHKRIVVT